MQVVLQRVQRAAVRVDGEVVGAIGTGLMALVGVARHSVAADAGWLAAKTSRLRIFGDEHGQMNRDLHDVDGAVLAISQFTLYGDVRKGRRPSFITAAGPAHAEELYESYCEALSVPVERGRFGAHMEIEMVADGPVTILLRAERALDHEGNP